MCLSVLKYSDKYYMRINEILIESELSSKIGDAIRHWTANTISTSGPRFRKLQIAAANFLATIPNQRIPNFAFRAFSTNIKNIKSWEQFVGSLNSNYPEAYSNSLRGVKSFLREPGVGSTGMIIGIVVSSNDFMFDIKSLAEKLPSSELRIPDSAGYSIKQYLSQHEVVLRPGTLKRAILSGNAFLVGYEIPGTNQFKWLRIPKIISANS